MKTLLIRPPYKHVGGAAKPSASLPLGLLYIAAVLDKNNYTVEIYDAQVNVYAPVCRDSDGNIHMGDRWEVVEAEITKRTPDLVGITCPFTAQKDYAIKTAEIVKKINKDIITVVGGNHASARPKDFFLKTNVVDIVCVGEGEFTMLDIVERFKERESLEDIPGTVIRSDYEIKTNQPRLFMRNLDKLPFPAYHFVNLDDYFSLHKKGFTDRPSISYSGSERTISVITSRGCPYNCIFCSIHVHMGRNWRYHSSEYVVHHLEMLVKKYDVKHVHFEDDNLINRSDRFAEILKGMKEKDIFITWDTPNGVRVDTMSKEIIKECVDHGCTYLIFGVESGNQNVLNKIVEKRLNLDKVIQVASWCKEERINTMAFFVIGFPGEKGSDMRDTIEFALMLQKKYDVTPSVFVATPLPGTRLEKLCLEKGILKSGLSAEELAKMTQGAFIQDGDTFNADDVKALIEMFYKKYKVNFIKSALLFFLRYPQAFFRFVLVLIKGKKINKISILNMLQHKYCLLQNILK